MFRYFTPSRHNKAQRDLGRRALRRRPECLPLEDRRLLSVAISEIAPAVPDVGSPVIWLAGSKGLGAKPVYQFSVAAPGGGFQVVRDFSPSLSFTWNPMLEGTYTIKVVVKPNFSSSKTQSAAASYTAHSRVTGDSPVVSPMNNPLVALYSAPPSAGSWMSVQFAQAGPALTWQSTAPLPITPGKSTNFIVAGMLPNTTYLMRYYVNTGAVSAPIAFTTGSLPSYLNFPSFTVLEPPQAGVDPTRTEIFHAGYNVGPSTFNTANTVATDLSGNVIWYYDLVANNFPGYAQNLEPGGTIMMLGGHTAGVAGGYDTLRQVDLAGDTLRETNIYAVNAELAAMHGPHILDFDHEAKLLPNGDIAVIAATPKTVDYKGKPTQFIGDAVVVLNPNLRPVWVWNSFNWLNTNRLGTDNPVPSDWLHANAVSWSPSDNNLIVSLRTQDWVVKISYANGKGNGHIVWKLGANGNFTAGANTPQPWFSHQHDAHFVSATTFLVFDDGNTREATDKSAHSRGQEWTINEANKTATLVVNADLGTYSGFLGSSQLLPNGNLTFTSGGIISSSGTSGQSVEVLPSGAIVYNQRMSEFEYRSYFENTLYSAGILD